MKKIPKEATDVPISPVFVVPEAHRAAVLDGLEQAERGVFISDDEMAALWKMCGL